MRDAKKKILVLAACPRNQPQIRLGEEMREIESGLQAARQRDLYSVESRWAVRPRDLQQALLDLEPQFVHFSGHGAGAGGLVLENNEGKTHLVPSEALGNLFSLFANRIECVLLNACYSEVQAEAIAQHIPYVIGMTKEIGDRASIRFSMGFYGALGAGRSIEFAFKIGCNAIELERIPENLTPVLKLRRVNGPSNTAPETRSPAGGDTDFSILGRMSREEIQGLLQQYKAEVALNAADGDSHFNLGLVYLQLKLHDLALRHFQRTIDLSPEHADAYYYLGLTLVRGRRPKTLSFAEVKEIERHVETACQLDDRPAKYYLLLGIVKQDYYTSNGLSAPPPSSAELFELARAKRTDAWEAERLLTAVTLRDERLVSLIRAF